MFKSWPSVRSNARYPSRHEPGAKSATCHLRAWVLSKLGNSVVCVREVSVWISTCDWVKSSSSASPDLSDCGASPVVMTTPAGCFFVLWSGQTGTCFHLIVDAALHLVCYKPPSSWIGPALMIFIRIMKALLCNSLTQNSQAILGTLHLLRFDTVVWHNSDLFLL